MDTVWTIWYSITALFIASIWVMVIVIIRKRAKYINVQFVDEQNKPFIHKTVYGFFNNSVYYKSFMGSSEGNSQWHYQQEFNQKIKPIGKTNEQGVFKYCNYLQPLFGISLNPNNTNDLLLLDHINTTKEHYETGAQKVKVCYSHAIVKQYSNNVNDSKK